MNAIVWFRQDLRFRDNPALHHAAKNHENLFAVYIYSPGDQGKWPAGSSAKWWLQESLTSFAKQIQDRRGNLHIAEGSAKDILIDLCQKENISAIYCNRCYEPCLLKQEKVLKEAFAKKEISLHVFDGNMLLPPHRLRTKEENVYQVYTPFWKALEKESIEHPLPIPYNLRFEKFSAKSLPIQKLALNPSWNLKQIPKVWKPGEEAAQNKFRYFLHNKIEDYKKLRDYPAEEGTSRLSPHLHLGEISPKEIWHKIMEETQENPSKSASCYLQELVWREFSYYLLVHFPDTPEKNLKPQFDSFPWEKNQRLLKAWQKGETGVPIVDAAMKQLWETGWMHNRLRMIVGSYLIKDCFIHWLEGAKWFWDTLVDADLASNTMGWQWVAGCGADAAPFFRVFNPYTQAGKFDSSGDFIRKYLPQLKKLPDEHLYDPSKAPEEVLRDAGVQLDDNYPRKIVDHDVARKKALEAFENVKKSKS